MERHQQEELQDATERHLRRMAEMATLLQAWTTPLLPPTPECTDGGKQWMSCWRYLGSRKWGTSRAGVCTCWSRENSQVKACSCQELWKSHSNRRRRLRSARVCAGQRKRGCCMKACSSRELWRSRSSWRRRTRIQGVHTDWRKRSRSGKSCSSLLTGSFPNKM